MGNIFSWFSGEIGKSNLEVYVNDIYEKECVIKIDQEESDFIQTGIETLVQKLVEQLVEDIQLHEYFFESLEDFKFNFSDFCIRNLSSDYIIHKAYFHLPDNSSLHKYKAKDVDKIPNDRSSIIRVGSFYDGTKNSFPDEFDFIFPLLDVNFPDDGSIIVYIHLFGEPDLSYAFWPKTETLRYSTLFEDHNVNRQLTYNGYLYKHGPAYKVQFSYDNGSGNKRDIHVDIVPAFWAININYQQWFIESIKSKFKPKTFREQMSSIRKCLIVGHNLTFTELEKEFMTNTLSKKHVKVYRVLKYILNGHGDNENLYRIEDSYCSYRIKVLMIFHHDDCENTDTEDLAPCVLQVLEEMSKYSRKGEVPSIDGKDSRSIPMFPFLLSMIADLREMEASVEKYDYENDQKKSVVRQYLDSKQR